MPSNSHWKHRNTSPRLLIYFNKQNQPPMNRYLEEKRFLFFIMHTEWSIFNLRTYKIFAIIVALWLKSPAGVNSSKSKKCWRSGNPDSRLGRVSGLVPSLWKQNSRWVRIQAQWYPVLWIQVFNSIWGDLGYLSHCRGLAATTEDLWEVLTPIELG